MVVHLFTVAGQSNAVGRGDSQGSPSIPTDDAIEYIQSTDSLENPLTDPVDGNSDASDTGSAWPAYCDEYLTLVGETPAIVGTAKGGTAQNSTADTGSGNWDTGGQLQADAVTWTNNAITKLEAAGNTVEHKGILWHQGERDAQSIDAGDITKSEYKSALESMIATFRSDFGSSSLPFWIFELGRPDSGDTSGFQSVREAQQEVASETSDCEIVSSVQKDFPAQGKMLDNFHYNQTGLNEMGREGARTVSHTVTGIGGVARIETTSSGALRTSASGALVASLVGSGSSALKSLIDGHEDGNLSDWSSVSAVSISSTVSFEGDNSMHCDGTGLSNEGPIRPLTDKQYDRIGWAVRPENISTDVRPQFRIRDSSGSYGPLVTIDDGTKTGTSGQVLLYDGSWIDTGVTVATGTFYEFITKNYDWSAFTYDFEVLDSTGSSLGEVTNVAFQSNISSIAEFYVFGSNVPYYQDYLYE